MTVGQVIVLLLTSFRYYEGTCYISGKDTAGVTHESILGSATTYTFSTMIGLRKQNVKYSLEYVGTVQGTKDPTKQYERFKFKGWDLE